MGASGQKPVTLSICMMVKDEEKNLKRCLPSLEGIADELVVVDTGSCDNTIEVAKSFGAKVFEHPWENDFSKHRNQTIEYASGDWVFIIDADEELFISNSSSASNLKTWLENVPDDCVSAAIVLQDIQQNMQAMRFNSVRLFRRGCVRYEGIVHNTPKIINGRPEAIFCPYVYLKHYGYDLSPEGYMKKRARTEGLLLKRVQKNPDDVVAYFYLVQAYTAHSEYEKAVECIEKYEEVSKRTGIKFNGSIFCTAFHVYRRMNDKQNAQKWLLAGLKEYPEDLDLLMSLTEFGVWVADVDLVVKGGRGFLKIYSKYQESPVMSGNRFTYANTSESLAYCLFHLCMVHLQEGCTLLDRLKTTLNDTHEQFKSGITNDVNTVFGKFGITKDNWNTNIVNLT